MFLLWFSLWSFRLILISLTRRPDSVPYYATINQMSISITTDKIIVAWANQEDQNHRIEDIKNPNIWLFIVVLLILVWWSGSAWLGATWVVSKPKINELKNLSLHSPEWVFFWILAVIAGSDTRPRALALSLIGINGRQRIYPIPVYEVRGWMNSRRDQTEHHAGSPMA